MNINVSLCVRKQKNTSLSVIQTILVKVKNPNVILNSLFYRCWKGVWLRPCNNNKCNWQNIKSFALWNCQVDCGQDFRVRKFIRRTTWMKTLLHRSKTINLIVLGSFEHAQTNRVRKFDQLHSHWQRFRCLLY